MASLRIAHTYDMGLLAIMKSLLESEGIQVLDIAMSGHLTIAGADMGYYVEVIPDHKARALRILRENDFGDYALQGVD